MNLFHAPSQDSNLKTKGLTLAASLQPNVFNVLKSGSPCRRQLSNFFGQPDVRSFGVVQLCGIALTGSKSMVYCPYIQRSNCSNFQFRLVRKRKRVNSIRQRVEPRPTASSPETVMKATKDAFFKTRETLSASRP